MMSCIYIDIDKARRIHDKLVLSVSVYQSLLFFSYFRGHCYQERGTTAEELELRSTQIMADRQGRERRERDLTLSELT